MNTLNREVQDENVPNVPAKRPLMTKVDWIILGGAFFYWIAPDFFTGIGIDDALVVLSAAATDIIIRLLRR